MMQTISACILTCNEAEKLKAAAESVLWVDEIVVVDSYSTDATAEITTRLAPSSCRCRSMALAICAIAPSKHAAATGFSASMPTSAVPPRCAMRSSSFSAARRHRTCTGCRIADFMMGRWIRSSRLVPEAAATAALPQRQHAFTFSAPPRKVPGPPPAAPTREHRDGAALFAGLGEERHQHAEDDGRGHRPADALEGAGGDQHALSVGDPARRGRAVNTASPAVNIRLRPTRSPSLPASSSSPPRTG